MTDPTKVEGAMRFVDKVVIVTGSSRNIGLATARRFGEEGAKLVINAATSADELKDAEESLRAQGIDVRAVLADTSKQADAERLISSAVETFGRLDVLIIMHANRQQRLPMEITPEEWHNIIGINLHSAFYLCQAAVPHLIEAGNASILCVNGPVDASKPIGANREGAHGLAGLAGRAVLMQNLAYDLAPKGVRVNFVQPGITDVIRKHPEWYEGSDYGRDLLEGSSGVNARIPMRRIGKPDEVAEALMFLASDKASYCVGTTLKTTGGIL